MIRFRSILIAALATVGFIAPHGRAVAQRVTETTLALRDGSVVRYGISVPSGTASVRHRARPLVLALHPGGRSPFFGSAFMRDIVEPALRSWDAVLIAPDVPDRSWATARSEAVVIELIEHVLREYAIDRSRVLVTGFSMGGRGTWHLAARHPDIFTGAIVMAGTPGDGDVEAIRTTPLLMIHSPNDEVVPFEEVEAAYLSMAARGQPVEMIVLPGVGHYSMGAYVSPLRAAGSWMLGRWATR
jgi:predicted peptidase